MSRATSLQAHNMFFFANLALPVNTDSFRKICYTIHLSARRPTRAFFFTEQHTHRLFVQQRMRRRYAMPSHLSHGFAKPIHGPRVLSRFLLLRCGSLLCFRAASASVHGSLRRVVAASKSAETLSQRVSDVASLGAMA